jgi:hypothetical protein
MGHVRPSAVVASALAASDAGVKDADNAAAHGVAVKTIRRWRRLYQRQGLPRGQAHTSVPCHRCDRAPLDEPAYAELLGWYLGDGYLSAGRRGVWHLHVYNDARYTLLNAHIATVMRRVKPGGRPHTRFRPGCLVTTVSWKHWPCLFPQHGPGRKHERPILLEDWQREIVERHPGDFLRGLFHGRLPHPQLGDPRGGGREEAVRLPALGVREPVGRHPGPLHLGPRPLRDRVATTARERDRGLPA